MCGGSSESASTTQYDTTSSQVTGGAGADSTTVNAGGSVLVETGGKEVSLAALSGMGDVVREALDNVSQSIGSQAEANQLQAINSADLVKTILSSNDQLAQNSSTGGATAAIKQTNYIIWGLISLAALGVGLFFWKRT